VTRPPAGRSPPCAPAGAFAGLVTRTNPIALEVNRRQHHLWERDALDHLRDGTRIIAVVATTKIATADNVEFQPGDRIVTRIGTTLPAANDGRQVPVANGQRGTITTINPDHGLTAERSWILFSDALYRQWGYVALSRARDHTQIYLVAGDNLNREDLDRHAIQPDDRSPTKRMTNWLDRSKAQQLALDFTLNADDT
jgi:hypothetical protein